LKHRKTTKAEATGDRAHEKELALRGVRYVEVVPRWLPTGILRFRGFPVLQR